MKRSILVVDDDPDTLELIDLALGNRYRFIMTTDADSALSFLELEEVDAMVVDYRMPGMDGLALLECARERQIDKPCLLITAWAVVAPPTVGVAILYKPCSVAALSEALERVLDDQDAHRGARR